MILLSGVSSGASSRLLELIPDPSSRPLEPRWRARLPGLRFITAAILALAACGSTQPPLPSAGSADYLYTCPDEYRFSARILSDSVVLKLSGRAQTLPQVIAASGVKYQEGDVVFWTKGNTARLEIGSTVHDGCAGVRAEILRVPVQLRPVETR